MRDLKGMKSFFTHFSNMYDEGPLQKVFEEKGSICQLVIPRKCDRKGWRFGFVSYVDMKDNTILEREHDSIRLDGMKQYVNKPRFPHKDA